MGGRPSHPYRMAFMAALAKHIAKHREDLDRVLFVGDAVERGVSAATAHRWINEALEEARAPRRTGEKKKTRPAVDAAPAAVVDVSEIRAAMPETPSMADVARMGVVPVIELLRGCIDHAQKLIRHATAADGGVRNARLLLHACEHLRRAIETAAKLNETVAVQQEMQRFHTVVMAEIAKEPPAVQERILVKIRRACDMVLQDV